MATINEEVNEWIDEYDNADTKLKYIMITELYLKEIKIEKIREHLKTRDIPRSTYQCFICL